MKKTAIAAEDTRGPIAEPWARAVRLLDAELMRRAAAERTRRAYGIDAGQFARWATAAGLEPRTHDDARPAPLRRRR